MVTAEKNILDEYRFEYYKLNKKFPNIQKEGTQFFKTELERLKKINEEKEKNEK